MVSLRSAIGRREARLFLSGRQCLLALAITCFVCVPGVAAAAQVHLAWDASSDPTVTGYRVFYGTVSGAYSASIDAGSQTSVFVSGLTNGGRYYFVVRAYNTWGMMSTPSNEASGVAAVVLFTDDPLTVGAHVMKVVHITELRSRIDSLRTANGLGVMPWADALTPYTTPARAVHLTEMRTALTAVYVARGLTGPVFTDPVLVAGTHIRASHITELRNAVKALE